jgi:hypothetical protein
MQRFRDFFVGTANDTATHRAQRWILLLVVPLVLGWESMAPCVPSYSPPVEIFQRHPTTGEEILSRIEVPEWVGGAGQLEPSGR